MSGHLKCRCDKPITDGAHLCAECVARVRDCLSKISERWEDLTDALASSEEGGEAGRQKGGMVSVGTNLNEAVSRARSLCSEILWFTVQVIREDFDDAGRAFNPPRWADEGEMAAWILQWQVPHITATTARETAEEIATDLVDAEKATWEALNPPPRWIAVTGCTMHTTSDKGERDPCTGVLRAKVGTGVMPDLECDSDPSHVISPTTWGRPVWKRKTEPSARMGA